MNINEVRICGNLTRDPELKYTPQGTAVAKFSIAVNRQYKGGDGEMKKEVEFINVEVWGKTAENCGKFLHKGSEAYVAGRLKTDSYEKDGQKRSFTKVVADSVQFGSRPRIEGERPRIEGERPAGGDEHPQFDGDGDVPF